MKRYIIILFCALGAHLCAHAQDAQHAQQDTLQTEANLVDTISQGIAEMDSLLIQERLRLDSLRQDSIQRANIQSDSIFFESTLDGLDNLSCQIQDTVIPELPDEIYIERLQALPFVIEMPYNHVVKGFIQRYTQRNPKQLAALQQRSDCYFPMFTDVLGRYGLPYELCYLPVIESALNPSAHSHAGAAGLWQFMPSTGRLYGLEINSLVDERMDPYKSTEAACRFLQALYNTFHDWNLAIAAYNCGPGNVNKAIHRAGGKRDFWSIYPYLPRETRSYLPIFIAAAYSMNYAQLHGVCPAELDITIDADTIHTNKRQHLLQISEVLGIDMDELRRLNPQYTRDILPGQKDFTLCLPAERMSDYIDWEEDILNHRADELINNRRAEIDIAQQTANSGGVTYYKIKRGDTLGGIAKKYHCSVKELKKWNNLKSDNIREGQKLKIMK